MGVGWQWDSHTHSPGLRLHLASTEGRVTGRQWRQLPRRPSTKHQSTKYHILTPESKRSMAGDGTSDDDDLLVGGGGVRESLALLVREGSKTVLPIQQAWPLRLQRPVAYQKLYHERTSAGCPWLSSPPAFLRDDIVRCSPLQRPTGNCSNSVVRINWFSVTMVNHS